MHRVAQTSSVPIRTGRNACATKLTGCIGNAVVKGILITACTLAGEPFRHQIHATTAGFPANRSNGQFVESRVTRLFAVDHRASP